MDRPGMNGGSDPADRAVGGDVSVLEAGGAGRSRRSVVTAVVVVAALIVGASVVAAARRSPTSDGAVDDGHRRTGTTASGPGTTAPFDLPEAELPRLLVDGASISSVEPDAADVSQVPEGELQTFRPPGQLLPVLFLTTSHEPGGIGPIDPGFGDPVTVRGHDGHLAHSEPEAVAYLVVDLGDGSVLSVMAVGLTDTEIVRFLDGLARDELTDPWTTASDVRGLREVPVRPPPPDARRYGARFGVPAGAVGATVEPLPSFGLNLSSNSYELRLQDRIPASSRPVEVVEIGGVPAVLGTYDENKDYWLLVEPEPARVMELRIAGDRATVDWIIAHARFVDEPTWDAATANAPSS